ncbi:Glycerol kinase [Camellia lanceoleosa]|uniref:Glycerol kinase n=1 Tax=Camellia lanceoleosa TaxID=1840588 RepID=A0ACC0FNX5_9ERIC|nr:Glycerol kinase [Camellia lanceoleosa]
MAFGYSINFTSSPYFFNSSMYLICQSCNGSPPSTTTNITGNFTASDASPPLTASWFRSRWIQHDPMEITESVKICMSKAIDKASIDGYNVDGGLKAIGLTNQRETTVVWSKSIGLHLYNAIVWMDVCTSSLFIH